MFVLCLLFEPRERPFTINTMHHIIFIVMSLVGLFSAQASTATASTTTATDSSLNYDHLTWTGAWQFEESWFGKQHPWLPGFIVRQALQSKLILHSDFYHQVDGKGRALKKPRRLRLVGASSEKADLERTEGNKQVSFAIEKRTDGFMYYVEKGFGEYRLIPADDGEAHMKELQNLEL
jgi:hypothetical protein